MSFISKKQLNDKNFQFCLLLLKNLQYVLLFITNEFKLRRIKKEYMADKQRNGTILNNITKTNFTLIK